MSQAEQGSEPPLNQDWTLAFFEPSSGDWTAAENVRHIKEESSSISGVIGERLEETNSDDFEEEHDGPEETDSDSDAIKHAHDWQVRVLREVRYRTRLI
ncbi:MAG: hypothetical protein Q9160_009209 [Pyrenula sp. 1 TL-2023]